MTIGMIEIVYDDNSLIVEDIEYYTVQSGFLVIAHSNKQVSHYNLSKIEAFDFYPLEEQEQN